MPPVYRTPRLNCWTLRRRGGSAIEGRTTRHLSYRISQIIRKRIEEHFGWGKTIGRIRQTVFRGLRRVDMLPVNKPVPPQTVLEYHQQ